MKVNMITKPNSPEKLYQFFTQGMLRKPTEYYPYIFRREGWYIYRYTLGDMIHSKGVALDFFTSKSMKQPKWELEVYKYVDA